MHIVLEGEQLAGKSTVARQLRRIGQSISIVENPSIIARSCGTDEDAMVEHFDALLLFCKGTASNCVVCRGPASAYAVGAIQIRSTLERVMERFPEKLFLFAFLEIDYEEYLLRFRQYVRQRGLSPHSRAAFDARAARLLDAATKVSAPVVHLRAEDYEYARTARELAVSAGWET